MSEDASSKGAIGRGAIGRDDRREPSFSKATPEGDTLPRSVCDHCGFIDYVNPKVIVGSLCTWQDRLLLCRRAIAPRIDSWTIPAGFLEVDETLKAGAIREAQEEAEATVVLSSMLAVFAIPHISQVQIIFSGELQNEHIAAGFESREVALFDWADIPWDELAFPTVEHALRYHHRTRGADPLVPLYMDVPPMSAEQGL